MANLWLLSRSFVRPILSRVLVTYYMTSCVSSGGGGILDKVLYGEALPGGLTPYPFICHFSQKGTLLVYLPLAHITLSHTRSSCYTYLV